MLDRARNYLGVLGCAAATAAAAATSQPVIVQALDCRGDEGGGWRLDANLQTAQLTTQTPRRRDIVFRGSLQALASVSPAAVVWRGDSTHLPRETLVLTAREEGCAAPATYRAVLSIRAGEAASGCCTVRAGYDARIAPVANLGAKPADDWTRAVIDLLPAINACIAREGGKVKAVAGSSGATQGPVRVRLIETGGDVECTVDAGGRGTASITNAAPATAGGPLFYPPREPPPIVACGRLERVLTPRGALAGYLHYDAC